MKEQQIACNLRRADFSRRVDEMLHLCDMATNQALFDATREDAIVANSPGVEKTPANADCCLLPRTGSIIKGEGEGSHVKVIRSWQTMY
ncbi:MAG: hypothetical protein LBD68_00845 [Zoogloeaceae bacterium]|jgi:hypothetical protein|nr:hypothetical protein [Zoogloeaceae bacterium]